MSKRKRMAKELDRLVLETDCIGTKSIEEINEKYEYADEYPDGEGDSDLVACGQANGYNELKYIYREKLKKHVDAGTITKDDALKALCLACAELENPRLRTEFYSHLENDLGIKIS